MICDSRPHGRLPLAGRRLRFVTLAAGLALLAGCGRFGGGDAAPAAAVPPPPQDPVVAFAASAQPGATSRIALAGGQATPVRLLRSYNAASGRECREVLVGAGNASRPQLVCRTESGDWAAARPLLRGGGAGRP
jgi:hypothetical protein